MFFSLFFLELLVSCFVLRERIWGGMDWKVYTVIICKCILSGMKIHIVLHWCCIVLCGILSKLYAVYNKYLPSLINTFKPTTVLDAYAMRIVTVGNVSNTPTIKIYHILFLKVYRRYFNLVLIYSMKVF